MKGWLIKPFIVEHGTRALLFQAGRLVGELEPGRYDMDGLLSRLTNFMIDRAASVVVMDAGDAPVELENGDLWTADRIEVGTRARLIMRMIEPDSFFQNLMKGRGRLTLDELEYEFAGEIQMLLKGIVAQYESGRLFDNLDVRNELEAQLQQFLGQTLSRFGLEMIQLRFIDFAGPVFEELRCAAVQSRCRYQSCGAEGGAAAFGSTSS